MGTFDHLQRKSPLASTPAIPAPSLLRPSRQFAPLSPSQQDAPVTQAQPWRARPLEYSFDRIPIFSPAKKNDTGLPDTLKSGVENLSGMPMDDVQVHYHSSKPAQLQALAYTQGTDIHVAPGQEQHLAHEVWHVVQQKQGRVQPTLQAKGMAINDDANLEREANVMGTQALQMNRSARVTTGSAQQGAILLERGVETKGASQLPDQAIQASEEKVHLNFLYSGGVGVGGDRSVRYADAVTAQGLQGKSGMLPVQRMVIPIGDLHDPEKTINTLAEQQKAETITRSANILKGPGEIVRLSTTGATKPLTNLPDNEEMVITAHGGTVDQQQGIIDIFGGKTPEDLAALLVANGLKPSYSGVIYLNGCNTAVSGVRNEPSYIARFQKALNQRHKRQLRVRGNLGDSHVLENGTTGIRINTPEANNLFDQITLLQERIQDESKNLRLLLDWAQGWKQSKISNEKMAHVLQIKDASPNAIEEKIAEIAADKEKKIKDQAAQIQDCEALLWDTSQNLKKLLPRPYSENEIVAIVALFSLVVLLLAVATKRIFMP